MPIKNRSVAMLLAMLLCILALMGCAQRETAEEDWFVLRIGVGSAIRSLDPASYTNSDAASVFHALYENLMRMENDGEGGAQLAPGVAKEYKVSPEFDGTVTYRFTLRSGARWSDGERVKAGDFVYAWRRLIDPATDSPNHAMLSMIKGYDEARETGDMSLLAVSAENDHTLKVTLSAPYPHFVDEICTAIPTMPLRRSVISENPEFWAQSDGILGNGPFCFNSWVKGEYLQLRRNDAYYERRLVSPDALRFVYVDSETAAYELYQEGRVDGLLSLPASRVEEYAEAYTPVGQRTSCCVIYNHMSDTFSDAHVRRAFDLAIDRTAAAAAQNDAAQGAAGFVPAGVPNGTEDGAEFRSVGGELCALDAEKYPERCAAAVEQLEQAGYFDAQGFPSVEILCRDDDGSVPLAIALQEMWSTHLGVNVSVTALPAERYDARILAGTYDLALKQFDAPYGDALLYLERFSGLKAENEMHYANEIFDLLIRVTHASEDPAARSAFLHDAEALLLEDAALSPVSFGARAELLRDGLQGVYHDARGVSYFTHVTSTASAG